MINHSDLDSNQISRCCTNYYWVKLDAQIPQGYGLDGGSCHELGSAGIDLKQQDHDSNLPST